MANEDHLALLRQGVDAWNAWRGKEPSMKPDLRGADLTEADLSSRAGLHGTDRYLFSRAGLYGADLTEADLREAILSGANLNGTDLRSADLRGAHLDGADLLGAHL